jgi:hypothetical protein
MEAKLTSIGEATLGAALQVAEFSDGDPASLLMFAGTEVSKALYEIELGAVNGDDNGKAYHDLAAMALLACAAYHEMRRDT